MTKTIEIAVEESLAEEATVIEQVAKFVTNVGSPPFTFLVTALVVGLGAQRGFNELVPAQLVGSISQFFASLFSALIQSPSFDFSESFSLSQLSAETLPEGVSSSLFYPLLVGVFGGIVPLLVLVFLRSFGFIQSLDLDTFQERVIGFGLALACGALLLPLLSVMGAPELFLVFVLAHLFATGTLCLLTLITMRHDWKVSVHSGGGACLIYVSLLFLGWPSWIGAVLAAVLISWSRLFLEKHTWSQIVLGLLLGFCCYALVFAAFGLPIV